MQYLDAPSSVSYTHLDVYKRQGNTPGIFALSAGIGFVQTIGIDEIAQHELSLIRELYDALAMTANCLLYTSRCV